MANWFDYLSLAVTLAIISALAYGGFLASKAISSAVDSAKDSLKTKGVDVSRGGVSVKTNKRYDREDYLDATQRGFIKAMKASSGGNQAGQEPSNGQLEREASVNEKQKTRSRRSQAEK
ncbi:uncharacterized protein TRAVEDRAFT_75196 [Trametes versicolor FP-101664 SS1]|uniref:uncharacterized protein n=1 Tax=Trametes versicolor (strain FP-101664) TaxID=717944 RepID=UPI00046226FE|nr:uncharacterized protein TRAVEDRAFT_75196 [Trametes versicolor FP-101664 SS1]EIW53005.1 hypothetical protein TRAVEDRAFT_75196 [Trametes versicolor FP-101664 SS1]